MYWIVTDSTIDMSADYVAAQHDFRLLNMTFTMDGVSRAHDGTDAMSREIYAALRGGKPITTAQVNAAEWAECFRELLRTGQDVLALVFSSGLSSTYLSAASAAEDVRAEFPERQLIVIDTLCASAGEGLLVDYALRNREAGMDIEQNAAWVRENIQRLNHWFTVDDLMFLLRGGRVNAASAYLGTVIRIKPILDVDEAGHLIPHEKVQGRKKSIRRLCEKVETYIEHPEEQVVFISHGDCPDDAQALADMIREKLPVKDIRISYIGPIVGAHSGPGTLAVFFLGKKRV